MDVATLQALQHGAGAALLADAVHSHRREDPFRLGTRLRRDHPPELVAAALTQARLRDRAASRFTSDDAARMFFTLDGYEQATRASVARRRAELLRSVLGPGAQILDLCCGIGGDLIELARAGLHVTGVDADPLALAVAQANVDALGLSDHVTLLCSDVTTLARDPATAVMCDPARRSADGQSRRSFRIEDYRPGWGFVEELLRGRACVKVGPGIPHARVPDGVHAEWVSDGGTVVEATLWSAALLDASPVAGSRRSATVLPAGVQVTEADAPVDVPVAATGAYLYEPDGAVIRAGLVTAVAARVDGWLLDPSIAYVSSDTEVDLPIARAYRVREVLPLDRSLLRRRVKDLDVGELVIKKRGVDVEPERLRRELRPKGSGQLTLILTRVQGAVRAILADALR